jgi:hypothetical protein
MDESGFSWSSWIVAMARKSDETPTFYEVGGISLFRVVFLNLDPKKRALLIITNCFRS